MEKGATTVIPDPREIPEAVGAALKTFGGEGSEITDVLDALEGISTR